MAAAARHAHHHHEEQKRKFQQQHMMQKAEKRGFRAGVKARVQAMGTSMRNLTIGSSRNLDISPNAVAPQPKNDMAEIDEDEESSDEDEKVLRSHPSRQDTHSPFTFGSLSLARGCGCTLLPPAPPFFIF